ncbi:MAG: hypothetical protein ABIZ91_16025 [Gemmatimonadaceae bacterium]
MTPGLFDEWRTERRMRRGLSGYVATIMSDPEPNDVTWLAAAACGGDSDRALWELRYARRALGLLVAQRDALDDRTGSLVARELATALQSDRNIAPAMLRVAERQFNDRLTGYRDVLSSRETSEGTGARLGRTLLQVSGGGECSDALTSRAGEILARFVGEANDALRKTFGAPALPPDGTPSTVGR